MSKRRDSGTGSVHQRSRDGYWVGTVELGWVDGKRRRKHVTAKRKADVVRRLNELQRRMLVGGSVATFQAPTVGEWLSTWLETMVAHRVAPRTLQTHRSYIDNHLIPHLGHVRLDKLTPRHVQQLHATLRATKKHRGTGTLEESTVLRAHAVLSRALTDAMRLGYIPHNPAQRVDRPTARAADEKQWLNLDQASMLLRAVADDPYGSRWAFALLTGQRQGEVLGLRWSHVDLDQGVADIAWKLERPQYRHGCEPACGHPKPGNCPARVLVMPRSREHVTLDGLVLTRPKFGVHKMVVLIPPLTAWLRRHRQEQPPGPYGLVWSHQDGRPIDLRDDHRRWVELLQELGLPPVTLHSARDTCVSLLLSLGVQEAVIMQTVGHSTVAASRRYQHLDRASAIEAATRLGQALQLEER